MNYYERHLGDYAKDTAHLSMLEHGAYTLLLDRCYATEAGIPEAQAHRIARARTKEERAAVDAVLAEFFTLEAGIWLNKRAVEEIEKARRRISTSRLNGKKGGRPRKEPAPIPVQTREEPAGFFTGSSSQTPQKAHQSPDTIYQTDQSSLYQGLSPEKEGAVLQRQGHIARLLQEAGIRPVSATHAQTIEWADNPAVTDEILMAAIQAARQYKPQNSISPAYIRPIVQQLLMPLSPVKNTDTWWNSHEGIDRKGRELGIRAKPMESYTDYKHRLFDAIRKTGERQESA